MAPAPTLEYHQFDAPRPERGALTVVEIRVWQRYIALQTRSGPAAAGVPTTTNSVQEFMQSYRAAWERRDLDEIVTMYGLPMLALQADGSRHCLLEKAECRQFFGAALDRYAATGFEAAELVADDVITAGRKVVLAAATWTLKRELGIVLMSARFTYNVRDGGDGWKIYASTPHEV